MNSNVENDELVIRIPKIQDAFDAIGEKIGIVPNLIGVIEGSEQGIHQLIDMTYKDKDPQVGGRFVQTYFTNDEFRRMCSKWGIAVFECPVCGFCKKPMWGAFTFKERNICCFDCDKVNDIDKKNG